jgi:NAD(P)-dependent dehydrogenase (short-subunit alcohol dehydrogenase family)
MRMRKDFFNFGGQIVLVTGSSKGIGKGIATAFAAAGGSVAVHYHNDKQGVGNVVSEITADGGQAAAFRADLTHEDQVARLIAQVSDHFGRLDVLVNNAGQYDLLSPLIETSATEWDQIINANLRSTFLCTQAGARQMIAQGIGGAIINIASIEGIAPMPAHSHYDAAKAGVIMLTRSSAQELGPHGIRVNAISPGLIWREGIEENWPEGVERWRLAAPLKRLGTPEDVANACLFLASPAAGWISGINLVLDGGVSARPAF